MADPRRQWLSLDHARDPEAFAQRVEETFGATARRLLESDRRTFLKTMAASFALSGLAACERPDQAESRVTGSEALQATDRQDYATSVEFAGWAIPVVAQSMAGRPLRLEANDRHPAAGVGLSPIPQAEVLRLFDPDRSRSVRHYDAPAGVKRFRRELLALREQADLDQGAGLAFVMGRSTSLVVRRMVEAARARWPKATWTLFDPLPQTVGPRVLRLDRADVIVALDCDFLGPGPEQAMNATAFATHRREAGPQALFVAEPTPTLTGVRAGPERLPAAPHRLPLLAAALAGDPADLTEPERTWVDRAVEALEGARGRALVVAGPHQPTALHAAAARVAAQYDGGALIEEFRRSPFVLDAADGDLMTLSALARRDDLHTVVLIDTNPAWQAPRDADFPAWLARVPRVIHHGLYADETAAHAHWHLPLAHPLESWGDGFAPDGTWTLRQPLIRPLFRGWSIPQLLGALLEQEDLTDHQRVGHVWSEMTGSRDERRWRRDLQAGFVADAALARSAWRPPAASTVPAPPERGALTAIFRPDPCLWDGSYANAAWLQELPKPLTKIVWDTAVLIPPALAERHGWSDGQRVVVETEAGFRLARVWTMPGQAADTVTVTLGGGRERGGSLAEGVGFDAWPLRPSDRPWQAAVTLRAAEGVEAFATTQLNGLMREPEPVRTVPHAGMDAAPEQKPHEHSFYPEWESGAHEWAMVIDLDQCIGCNACVTACQSENNIPVVGREQVKKDRAMHWLRVDRYWQGEPETPLGHFQPVPCMHCEKAPCELGCPVNATVHGPDGLNQMIYNRCIGTRTCASYCPYKVRRFNYFDYEGADLNDASAPRRNPEVTVRARGVMEKCTYCVQRIRRAEIEAHTTGEPVDTEALTTACAAACPTRAIHFGDKKPANSGIAAMREQPRHYELLHELSTRPRTTYLAKIEPGTAPPEKKKAEGGHG